MIDDLITKEIKKFKINDLIIAEHIFFSINKTKKINISEFNDIIHKLCLKKELIRLTKGVYYRPKVVNKEIVKISEKDIKKSLLNNKNGVLVGEAYYYESGLSSSPSYYYKIYLNEKFNENIKINNIVLVPTNIKLDKVSKVLISYLDVLNNFNDIKDINKKKFTLLTKNFIKNYNDIKMQDVIINSKVNKPTIAFLIEILNYFKIKNALTHFISIKVKYKIPKVDENLFK